MDNSMGKEKSDMKFSDIMGKESSGIGKFDHKCETIEKALGLDDTAKTRIIDVLSSKHRNCSMTIEDVLLSDKLHNTVERLLACYMAGGQREVEHSAHMMMTLIKKMGGIE